MKSVFVRLLVWVFLGTAGMNFLSGQENKGVQNRLQLAERFMTAGQPDKALALYEALYRQDPQPFVYQGYLNCLQVLEYYDQAEKLIRKQIRIASVPELVKVDLAANYLKNNQQKKAEAIFREITEKTDFMSVGLSVEELAGSIVQKTGRYDQAISVYRKARMQECGGVDPAAAVASGKSGKADKSGSRTGNAYPFETEFSSGIDTDAGTLPCDPTLYAAELADLYRLNAQYEPMLDEYIRLLTRQPDRTEDVYARLQALLSGTATDTETVSRTATPTRISSYGEAQKITETLKRLLYRKVQQQADDPVVQDMLIWVLLQEKDFQTALRQAQAYSRRFSDGGSKWFETIRTAARNGNFEQAGIEYETFIRQAEDPTSRLRPQLVRLCRIDLLNLYFSRLEHGGGRDKALADRLKQSYKKLLSELGRDPESFTMYRNLAKIYAYYAQEKDSAQLWLEQALKSRQFTPVEKAQLKIDLADILLYYNKVWDATLLYSQVEKDFKQDAVGFYAKLQNAKLFYYIGEFEWAKSQLNVLRAATSKLIANDAMALSLLIKEGMNPDSAYDGLTFVAKADLFVVRHLYEPALRLLDTVLTMPMEGGLFEEVFYRKARIYLALDSVEQSLYWLQKIYDNDRDGLLADDALFIAAGLLQLRAGYPIDPATAVSDEFRMPEAGSPVFGMRDERQKAEDKEKSMQLYQRLFMDFRSSVLAPSARQRYRQLRGDVAP